jgi:hypothetical protein
MQGKEHAEEQGNRKTGPRARPVGDVTVTGSVDLSHRHLSPVTLGAPDRRFLRVVELGGASLAFVALYISPNRGKIHPKWGNSLARNDSFWRVSCWMK